MSGTERIDGLLGDLQQLTEAGRDRILSLLPQEDVIALLKAALRERDQDRENIAVQTQLYQEAQLHQTPHVEPTVDVAREEPSNAASRTHAAATPQNRKRPRIDDPQTQIVENKPKPVAVKQEHETINLISDNEWNDSITVIQPETPLKQEELPPARTDNRVGSSSAPIALPHVEQTQTIEPPAAQTSSRNSDYYGLAALSHQPPAVQADHGGSVYDGLPVSPHIAGAGWTQANSTRSIGYSNAPVDNRGLPNLPACLLIRGDDGNLGYKSFVDLPNDVQDAIYCRFGDIWKSRPWGTDNYRKLLKYPEFYMSMPGCIRCLVVSRNCSSSGSFYTMGGSLKETADDPCITAGHPCAHFVRSFYGTINICFVPLPPNRRVGKVWTELGYWTE